MPIIEEIEVYSNQSYSGQEHWLTGSGYAVGGPLILTAAHVACPPHLSVTDVTIRYPGGPMFDCEVLWRSDEEEVDVALLKVINNSWTDPDLDGPVKWGRVVRNRSKLSCSLVGFPSVTANAQMRDSEQLSGFINPRSLVKSEMLAITLEQTATASPGRRPPWSGLSGAAVWHDEYLVAVVTASAAGYAANRLVALPVSRFAENPEFKALMAEYAGSAPFLETVSENPGVNQPPLRQVTDEALDDDLVFVICSFRPDMDPAYEAVAAAAERVGLKAARVKDVVGDYRITERMLSMIRRARFVVADLTHERPNVYFELGYARGIGKTVITIMRESTERHFDVYDWTYLTYADSRPLERMLTERFQHEVSNETSIGERLLD